MPLALILPPFSLFSVSSQDVEGSSLGGASVTSSRKPWFVWMETTAPVPAKKTRVQTELPWPVQSDMSLQQTGISNAIVLSWPRVYIPSHIIARYVKMANV